MPLASNHSHSLCTLSWAFSWRKLYRNCAPVAICTSCLRSRVKDLVESHAPGIKPFPFLVHIELGIFLVKAVQKLCACPALHRLIDLLVRKVERDPAETHARI